MTSDIAAILAIDGIASGAIYVLIAIGFVLIFAVTRVIFVPFGDIAAFTGLTLAALETRQLPGTMGLVALLAVLATAMQISADLRAGAAKAIPYTLLFYLGLPLVPVLLMWLAAGAALAMPVRIALSLLLILPISPLLDRIVFRPIADASVLLLLTVAMALHFALVGLGLLFFGPEGVRTQPLTDASMEVAGMLVSLQTFMIVASAVLFSGLLYAFFGYTITGKALRATAVNRTGARLVGIRPARAGTIAYLLASVLAGISGILISPVTTIFYDSGFLFGLRAFVGAIIGAMVSYPVTALGAVLVGLLESFASFWSSAFKEVIVFSFLIPVLLWRSLTVGEAEDEAEE
ncbi:branched-chain amino acid ABC transporter permease [Bosea sp. LjRoot9]|uniref:branched-chain amino acid ABC transporter permease n=1 Tax=Bosea sp. LjRoot9 TaxID=3342341 RepID=UPI003ED145E1